MKRNTSGFSMIEVLVAATILTMIVMMLGMIFQQTSQAWRTGRHRANTFEQVRGLFGAIQRDASMAVDEKALPPELKKTGNQSFTGSSLSFYTLSGSSEKNKPLRAITHVKYDGVKRTVTRFDPGMGNVPLSSDIVDQNEKGVTLSSIKFTAVGGSFPDYVTASAEVKKGSLMKNYDVGAASSGPDRTLGKGPDDIRGRDDIKTWAE